MTTEEAMKVATEIRAQRYDPRHYTTEFAAQQACMVLADALREAQARTYDDGVRDPIAEVRHACGRAYLSVADVAVAMEGDPMRDADLPEEAYEPIPADELDGATIGGKSVKGMDIRVVRSFRRDVWSTRTMKYVAKRINDAALLSPAPAVATVAAPRPLHPADCAHDSTPEVSVPHMPDPCGFVSDTNHVACPLPFGHAGWHQTPPVAAPKPVAFDAEAALVAAREAARTGLDRNPTVEARQIAHLLHRMLSDALAAGRGAR